MPTLGVLGCTVLTNELTYLVARDPDVRRAVIVDNKEGRKLAGKLESLHACEDVEMVEWDRLGSREYEDDELVIGMNSSEMHNSQERMRNAMTSEIMMMSGSVDCILLLYGQCRCQTLDIDGLERETGIPVVYLVDHSNVVVDDCISAIMGSSAQYLRLMREHKGAFFITPEYVEGYALKAEAQDIMELVEEIERMTCAFEALGHPALIKLDNKLGGGADYHHLINMFARTFDLEVMTIPCSMVVFEDSYDWAKSVMRARTRDREPVVVLFKGALGAPPFSEHMWEELDR